MIVFGLKAIRPEKSILLTGLLGIFERTEQSKTVCTFPLNASLP